MEFPRRAAVVALAAIFAAVTPACDNLGLGEIVPPEVARHQVPKVVTQERTRIQPQPPPAFPAEPVTVAGQRWVVSATEYQLPDRMVRPVGTAEQMAFYALAWDEPPYDRLLVSRAPGVWQEFLEVR